MYYRKIFIVFLFLGLVSCDTIFSKKQDNIQGKSILKPIDFTSIDAYPLLPECKKISSRALQKDCFYTQLANRIEKELSKTPFYSSLSIQDPILVKLQVNKVGKIKVYAIIYSDKIKENLPVLDSLIKASVIQIPQIQPAIKAGIPVTSEFTLPIVIEN